MWELKLRKRVENLKVWNSSHMYAFLIIHINTHANVDCYVANKYLSQTHCVWAEDTTKFLSLFAWPSRLDTENKQVRWWRVLQRGGKASLKWQLWADTRIVWRSEVCTCLGERFWTGSSRYTCPGAEAHLARLRISKLVGVPWSEQEGEQEEMGSVCKGGMGSLGFVLSGMRSH